jgi:hypothetical protein
LTDRINGNAERQRKTARPAGFKSNGRTADTDYGEFRPRRARAMRARLLVVVAVAGLLPGCMQTRCVETNSVSSCSAGECPSAANHSTYKERKWCGLWPFQPAAVQP